MARDDFADQVGSGGVNNFEFVVTDAWFGISEAFEAKVGGNTIFMHWVGTTDLEDERFQQLDQDGFHPSWKVGADWEVKDGGKRVAYDGPSQKPKMGSWYGRLAESALDLTASVANTDQDPLAGENHPSDATIWIGTKWFMEEKTFPGLRNPNDPEAAVRHLMPTEYRGRVGATSAAPTPAAAAANGGSTDVEGSVRDMLVTLAQASGSQEEFQPLALKVPGVTNDAALLASVVNGSLFAEVNG